nr:zinc finger, CCHC-type [Tanacetum cinerariifolium]
MGVYGDGGARHREERQESTPIPPSPVVPAGQHVALEILAAHTAWIKRSKEIIASRAGASSDYVRFSLLQAGRRANYNIHSMGKTVNELHVMLKLHEQTLPKNNAPALHAVQAGNVQKVNKHKKSQPQMAARGQNHEKGKNKLAYAPKPKIPPPPKREDLAKDSICHECGET